VLQPNPLEASSGAWDPTRVRGKLERRAQDAQRIIEKELGRIARDERARVTSQNAIDRVCAEAAICRALAVAPLESRETARGRLEALQRTPLPPGPDVKGLASYHEQWARTCEQLLREL
jgi:hypothetical protein